MRKAPYTKSNIFLGFVVFLANVATYLIHNI